MRGVLAVLSIPILVLGDRAVIVEHSRAAFEASAGRADGHPEEHATSSSGKNPEESDATSHGGTSPEETAAGSHSTHPEAEGKAVGSHSTKTEEEETAAGSHSTNPEEAETAVGSHSTKTEEAETAVGSHSTNPEEPAASSHATNPEEPAAEAGGSSSSPLSSESASSSGAGAASSSSSGGVKELDYDSMSAVSKDLAATAKEMSARMSGELTSKANLALKAGAAYAALLKEQYAGHLGFETGVKTFRSAVSEAHHKDTAIVRKALQSSKDGPAVTKTRGESMLTTDDEADLLTRATVVADDSTGAAEEDKIEKEAKSEEKGYDPKAMHVFLRWKKDVDLDLHLHAPNSKEVDTAFDKTPTRKHGENFIVKAAMNGKKEGGWYVEDISSAPGVLLPVGRYHAWATYASAVPGESMKAPTEDENVDVPFEAEFKLGDQRKLVKDTLVWQKGEHFHKINNSMLAFDFTIKGDNVVVWDSRSDTANEEDSEEES